MYRDELDALNGIYDLLKRQNELLEKILNGGQEHDVPTEREEKPGVRPNRAGKRRSSDSAEAGA